MLFTICCLVVAAFYVGLISYFFYGWRKTPYFEKQGTSVSIFPVSVVVACKNEQEHLPELLSALKKQTDTNFELILVNDHSSDNTLTVMNDEKNDFTSCIVLEANDKGKKAALKQGILQAKGELIITTDADCIPAQRWIETIQSFQKETHCDLIICPVSLKQKEGLKYQIQQLEFVSLITSGAGAAGVGKPILCNGANLAFKKSVWLESQNELHDEEQSGDDIFLLESVKRRNGKIQFLKSTDAIVRTCGSNSASSFFRQRRRWASKSTTYTDKLLIATACIVFGISLLQIIAFIAAIFNCFYWMAFALLFCIKYLIDASFLQSAKSFFKLKNIWINAFMLSLTYPFYITITAVSSFMYKPKRWK